MEEEGLEDRAITLTGRNFLRVASKLPTLAADYDIKFGGYPMDELGFYGLTEKPFSVNPDPRYLYISGQHKSAIAKALYVVDNRQGLKVIFGRVGTGKSTIAWRLNYLLRENPNNVVAFLPDPNYTSDNQLLRDICAQFKVPTHRSKLDTRNELMQFLAGQYKAGKNCVLVIDEAQQLRGPMFDLIRSLLNFEVPNAKLLQIVLLGQEGDKDDLRLKLRQKKALLSRVAMSSHLTALDPADARELIEFRLAVAGRKQPLFTDEAVETIYRYSKGIPREIIKLCMASLPLAAGSRLPMIGADVIEAAAANLERGED